jgi:hypothetical protein
MSEYTSEQLLEIVNQDDGLPGNPRVKQIARLRRGLRKRYLMAARNPARCRCRHRLNTNGGTSIILPPNAAGQATGRRYHYF